MRIAVVGSHGTGKTTVAENVSKKTWLPKLDEVAREVMDMFGKRPQDMTPEERKRFQIDVYFLQHDKEDNKESFISDRGIYDNLAYVYFVEEKLYELLKRKTKEVHQWYDKVYYTPIEFELQQDGVRFEDLEFQKQIDYKIKEILNVLNIEYEVLSWSTKQREQQILSYIQSQW